MHSTRVPMGKRSESICAFVLSGVTRHALNAAASAFGSRRVPMRVRVRVRVRVTVTVRVREGGD